MYEYELEAVVEYIFKNRGDRTGILVDCWIRLQHDDPPLQHQYEQIQDGEMVLIDAGAEYDFFPAISRGRFRRTAGSRAPAGSL
jgi:Xaa-Pro aminopeptidase